MRIRRFLFLTAGFLFAGCLAAGAEEKGKAGIAIGYPGGIGILWHATDSVAIRSDFSFSHNSTEEASSGSAGGVDLSVLFYVKKYDNVRTYVSPRFTYSRAVTNVSVSSPTQGTVQEIKSTSTNTGGGGVFGAQYLPVARFSVFGEVGIAFFHRHSKASSLLSASKGDTWGTTAGVGVVFYP
jgi:hypothetical protein